MLISVELGTFARGGGIGLSGRTVEEMNKKSNDVFPTSILLCHTKIQTFHISSGRMHKPIFHEKELVTNNTRLYRWDRLSGKRNGGEMSDSPPSEPSLRV